MLKKVSFFAQAGVWEKEVEVRRGISRNLEVIDDYTFDELIE
jgi:hypothetical protein